MRGPRVPSPCPARARCARATARVLLLLILLAPAPVAAQQWSAFGDETFDSVVYALTEFRGELIATGSFVSIGGRAVHHIARWDGRHWQPLGAGLSWDDPSYDPYKVWGSSLLVHDDQLYVGGHFRRAGDVAAAFVARWDGVAWSAVGAGFDNRVYDLALFGQRLIACGSFRWSGATRVEHVAQLVGGVWRVMESGVGYPAYALHAHGGFLYLGGMFSTTGFTGRPLERLAEWDGQVWRALATQIDVTGRQGSVIPAVLDFASHDGSLFVGGLFDVIDGRSFDSFAVYDGVSLERPDGGARGALLTHDRVFSLAVHEGELIIGGVADAGAPPAMQQLSRWDGSTYHEIGGGVNDYVQALLSTPEGLVVGGSFTRAGGTFLPALATWDGAAVVAAPPLPGTPEVEVEDRDGVSVRLRVLLARAEPLRVEAFDLRGRRVATVFDGSATPGATSIDWDARDDAGRAVARGRYFLRVGTGRGEITVGWTRRR